jgi:hypothetical protein
VEVRQAHGAGVRVGARAGGGAWGLSALAALATFLGGVLVLVMGMVKDGRVEGISQRDTVVGKEESPVRY